MKAKEKIFYESEKRNLCRETKKEFFYVEAEELIFANTKMAR